MARNEGLLTLYPNSIQENERILKESRRKSEVEGKIKDDFGKLFTKLNQNCQIKSVKDDGSNSLYNKHYQGTNYKYGPILGFPSGSWWGIRMDCSRNRVHDPFNEDIQNGKFGVTSICTSSVNVKEDVDYGDFLTLTGQKYLNGRSMKDPLLKNYENQIPVRLIRSYNLLNEYAPKTGYRYDGLYLVIDSWIGVNADSTKCYKFALARLRNQEAPAWSIKKSPLDKSFSTLYPTSKSVKSCPETSSLSTYAFKKYSHGSNNIFKKVHAQTTTDVGQFLDIENKRALEKQKTIPESAIVMRHVFKKTNTNVEGTNAASTSAILDSKSLSHIGTQASKAYSTNISIRTGLYDSSCSVQQDVRRSTLIPLCRSLKPVTALKTNLQAENSNTSDGVKSNKNVEGDTPVNTSNDFSIRINYNLPSMVNLDLSQNFQSECPNSKLTTEIPEEDGLKSLDSLDSLTPDKILSLISKQKYHPLSRLLMGNMIGLTSEQSIALRMREPSSHSETKEKNNENDAEESIEKQKFQATTEDPIGTRSYKFRRRKRRSRKMLNKSDAGKCDKKSDNNLEKSSASSVDMLGQSSTLHNAYNGSQTDTSKKTILYRDKRDKDFKGKLVEEDQTNSQGRYTTRLSMRTTETNKNEKKRTRLKPVRAIKSSNKKRIHKMKKRREIANLSIDANFDREVHGPRNSRLRRINYVYSKRSYERFSTAMPGQRSTFKGRSRGRLTKVNSYKRIRSNRDRAHNKNLDLSPGKKVREESPPAKKRSTNEEIVKSTVDNSPRSKTTKASVKSIPATVRISTRGRKIKSISSTTSTELNCNGTNEQTNLDKQIAKICTTDAITQCSLIREPLSGSKRRANSDDSIRYESPVEHRDYIKTEYNDSKDMKSEIYETILLDDESYDDYQISSRRSCPSPDETRQRYYTEERAKGSDVSYSSNISSMEDREETPTERVSAFVPVNVLDSDLDLRIARLRSIGFKPIAAQPSDAREERAKSAIKRKCPVACTSKVMKQDVAEKYNKYTNEENNVVVYMDDELQYQDIEDEDRMSLAKIGKPSVSSSTSPKKTRLTKLELEKGLCDDLESPWHGWKRVVTNEDSYWIGW